MTFFWVSSKTYEIAMKRDSKYPEDCREKLVGAKLYQKNTEPVLELCTDRCRQIVVLDMEGYTGDAHYSAGVWIRIVDRGRNDSMR